MTKESTYAAMSAIKAAKRANNVEEPKRKGLIIVRQAIQKTGKPQCTEFGLVNPIKLSLSENTLAKLRSLK